MNGPRAARPIGVTILALLGAIFGIFAVLAGLGTFGFGAFVTSSSGALGGLFSLIGALVLLLGILEVVFAYGVWLRRAWAWPLGVWVALATIVVSVLWILAGATLGAELISIVVSLGILYFLDGTAVRATFQRPAESRVSSVLHR